MPRTELKVPSVPKQTTVPESAATPPRIITTTTTAVQSANPIMGAPDQPTWIKISTTEKKKEKNNRSTPLVHTNTTVSGRCAPPDQRALFQKSQAPNQSDDAAVCGYQILHLQRRQEVENGTFPATPAATTSQHLPPLLPLPPPCQVPDELMDGIRSNFYNLETPFLNRNPLSSIRGAGSGAKAKNAQIEHRGENGGGGSRATATIVQAASHKLTPDDNGFSTFTTRLQDRLQVLNLD